MTDGRIAPGFGPFRPELSDAERAWRLRDLRTVAHILLGCRHYFVKSLIAAELGESGALEQAAKDLDALPTLSLRRVLGTYAQVQRVPPPRHFGMSGAEPAEVDA